MASLVIRNLDESLKSRLRLQAAEHGRSMEDEVRAILAVALGERDRSSRHVVDVIRDRFVALGGFEMPDLPREPMREPPALDA